MAEQTDPRVLYPPRALRDYAFLGDGERGALLGPDGDLAWMCAPAWDSDAVFATLIGGAGCYAVTPVGRFTWGGSYNPRSLIWTSRWVLTDGVVECRDALALPADPHTAVVLRRIRVVEGSVRLRVVLDVRAGFGQQAMAAAADTGRGRTGGVWTGQSGPLAFRWWGASEATRTGDGPLMLTLNLLTAGDQHDLCLEISDRPLPRRRRGIRPDQLWAATESGWRERAGVPAAGTLARRDAEQALATLTGLTSSVGGMAAAATMSLPEHAGAGRNYDYRYAWIRDQCYAGRAAAAHGQLALLDTTVDFVAQRLLADGPDLRPTYTTRGGPVPAERALTHLAGYPGGTDRAGNQANHQFQLDTFGEALELFALAAGHDRLDLDGWKAIQTAVDAITQRGHEPDAGIWELDDRRWAHSRLTCVGGLRAVAGHAPARLARRYTDLADALLADVTADCVHPTGRWQRSPDDPRVDAALLLPALRGALPPTDPRSRATVAAVEADLVHDDYVYRFRLDGKPLGEAEGAFLLCGFLLALARHSLGDPVGARALFERGRASCGSPGLFAEEFDVDQRQLRGNLPQAFVHALLLETAATLATDPPSARKR
ncbi:glycoside hydrolase family 15 protein [Pseudofrankia inefficax]|uniref:Glycoside hydrolase 15-related protein n=1 Tax=Pseudofrankia inefficax (strain DSM 45817 / CECT 9037 / DDB 130130 / EuI1c) TaxID=298654 RepID=E3J8I5_PSEI1|nr:glycoside hydrolase family 15 protein [Pseudofrankia inefficax]ADP84519.1 glycoside hydrolase 15-related protein [Pseudofrankia inefficax]